MTNEPGKTAGRNTMRTLAGPSDFPTTRWTLVIAAADPQRKEARSALVSLCEGYWYPLYAYVRRRGYAVDQAQDLTQEFFIRVLEGRYIDRADPEKGRFRAFLLTSMKFFLADEVDRNRAQKRGGGTFCLWKSRPAKSVMSASLRTTRRRSESLSGAGPCQCSTESWTDSGWSLCNMAALTISIG
jgi:DNA-directed RNA polymerase specialized sigma24 family protein